MVVKAGDTHYIVNKPYCEVAKGHTQRVCHPVSRHETEAVNETVKE